MDWCSNKVAFAELLIFRSSWKYKSAKPINTLHGWHNFTLVAIQTYQIYFISILLATTPFLVLFIMIYHCVNYLMNMENYNIYCNTCTDILNILQ